MVPECQGIQVSEHKNEHLLLPVCFAADVQDSKSLDEAQREYVYNKLETSPGVSFKIAQVRLSGTLSTDFTLLFLLLALS